MKRNRLFTAMLSAAMAVSCAVEPIPDLTETSGQGQTLTIQAVLDDSSDAAETKTVRNEDGSVSWQTGDRISLFFGSGSNGGSAFTTTDSGKTASFTGTIEAFTAGGEDFDGGMVYFWGLYPYDAAATCNNTSVTTSIPSTQRGEAGTFSPGQHMTLARSENLLMSFKSVCSGLRFSLQTEGVESAVFHPIGDEAVVGDITVSMIDGLPVVTSMRNTSSEINLIPDGGAFEVGKDYYFEFAPFTAARGFEVTLYKGNQQATFTFSTSRTFARNKYTWKTNLDEGLEWTKGSIPNNEIHYTASSRIEPYCFSGEMRIGEEHSFGFNTSYIDEDSSYNELTGEGILVFEDEITTVGMGAFDARYCRNASEITSITLPNSVETISAYAFYRCTGLSSFELPDSVHIIQTSAFEECTNLESVSFSQNLSSIGNSAFYACSSLDNVVLPESVTDLVGLCFQKCSSLSSITLSTELKNIGGGSFRDCVSLINITLPESLETIGSGAFSGSSLKSIRIPARVNHIVDNAFSFLPSLESITVASGNEKFDSRDNCNAIIDASINTLIAGCKNTVIPLSITRIGDYAFIGNTGLKRIIIPPTINRIGSHSFEGCTSLVDIQCQTFEPPFISSDTFKNVPWNATITIPLGSDYEASYYWDYSFSNYVHCNDRVVINMNGSKNLFDLLPSNDIVALKIKGSINNVGSLRSLCETRTLELLDLSDAVMQSGRFRYEEDNYAEQQENTIGSYLFWNTRSPRSIFLPSTVYQIGSQSLTRCYELVDIPSSVTSVGYWALSNGVKTVFCRATTPPHSNSSLFDWGSVPKNAYLFVPAVSVSLYKNTKPWSDFKHIEAIP